MDDPRFHLVCTHDRLPMRTSLLLTSLLIKVPVFMGGTTPSGLLLSEQTFEF